MNFLCLLNINISLNNKFEKCNQTNTHYYKSKIIIPNAYFDAHFSKFYIVDQIILHEYYSD